jgi:hypothetical protein
MIIFSKVGWVIFDVAEGLYDDGEVVCDVDEVERERCPSFH